MLPPAECSISFEQPLQRQQVSGHGVHIPAILAGCRLRPPRGIIEAMEPEPELDLNEIRKQIDDVDRRLIAVLAERARLVDGVVRYKRARHMAVVDRGREDEMLQRIADTAKAAGLDPRVAQQVLRTIIDGFTLLEVEELGPDT